jgi:hypothetical protein
MRVSMRRGAGAVPTRLCVALLSAGTVASAWGQGIDPGQRSRLARAQGAEWVLAGTLQRALVPDEPDTTLGIVTADRGALHLEARWNYEAIDAGTVFVGGNWEVGEDWRVSLTPMLGVAFGSLRGVVPALKASVAWRAFDFYTEAEYVRDSDAKTGSFLYAWSELGFAPADGWRLGFVGQRSRKYDSLPEVQRGVFGQVELGPTTLGLYVFDPTKSSSRLAMLMFGIAF